MDVYADNRQKGKYDGRHHSVSPTKRPDPNDVNHPAREEVHIAKYTELIRKLDISVIAENLNKESECLKNKWRREVSDAKANATAYELNLTETAVATVREDTNASELLTRVFDDAIIKRELNDRVHLELSPRSRNGSDWISWLEHIPKPGKEPAYETKRKESRIINTVVTELCQYAYMVIGKWQEK